ncbi:hypothetical protein D1007_10581 [Hordeum vulgare]|nr:hypothetical protein D1007_10581 [Hordeum vulgare]
MDKGNNSITKLLESLITKADEHRVLHDEQIEIQAAFNNKFPQELYSLAKKIDLTRGNIDATPGTLPPLPPADAPECCLLSSQALDGTDSVSTIHLRALVGNQVMLLLLDSSSTHSFVNKSFVERIGTKTEDVAPVDVREANGDRLTCNRMVPEIKWWMHAHTLSTPMRELEIGAYDDILGMDWLA